VCSRQGAIQIHVYLYLYLYQRTVFAASTPQNLAVISFLERCSRCASSQSSASMGVFYGDLRGFNLGAGAIQLNIWM